jgi:hypothetical protein
MAGNQGIPWIALREKLTEKYGRIFYPEKLGSETA